MPINLKDPAINPALQIRLLLDQGMPVHLALAFVSNRLEIQTGILKKLSRAYMEHLYGRGKWRKTYTISADELSVAVYLIFTEGLSTKEMVQTLKIDGGDFKHALERVKIYIRHARDEQFEKRIARTGKQRTICEIASIFERSEAAICCRIEGVAFRKLLKRCGFDTVEKLVKAAEKGPVHLASLDKNHITEDELFAVYRYIRRLGLKINRANIGYRAKDGTLHLPDEEFLNATAQRPRKARTPAPTPRILAAK